MLVISQVAIYALAGAVGVLFIPTDATAGIKVRASFGGGGCGYGGYGGNVSYSGGRVSGYIGTGYGRGYYGRGCGYYGGGYGGYGYGKGGYYGGYGYKKPYRPCYYPVYYPYYVGPSVFSVSYGTPEYVSYMPTGYAPQPPTQEQTNAGSDNKQPIIINSEKTIIYNNGTASHSPQPPASSTPFEVPAASSKVIIVNDSKKESAVASNGESMTQTVTATPTGYKKTTQTVRVSGNAPQAASESSSQPPLRYRYGFRRY